MIITGKASIEAGQSADIIPAAARAAAVVNISVCNTGSEQAIVAIAIRSGAVTAADYIEKGAKIAPGGVIERTAVAIAGGEAVTVYASSGTVAVRAHGFGEVA